jgi:glycosyltransferase involved in cell wall biosynthesis
MKLTIFSELSKGGIADYAHDQARALAHRGIEVELLCSEPFLSGRSFDYAALPLLEELRFPPPQGSKLTRNLRLARGLIRNGHRLRDHVVRARPDAVLTHFTEYMAPFWAPGLRRMRAKGISFHTVLHDPVRDYVVGPRWWHRLSVREAFSFLDTAFVHTHEPVPLPPHVAQRWVPYGIHSYPLAKRARAEVRAELDVPTDARLLTAYGYIRDNKNLDLVIEAIAGLPDVYLLVAGSEQRGGNRPISYYQALADRLGCGARCRWITRFISDEETADLLSASDLSVLTYARTFLSSSAALGVTSNYSLPCLISSGSTSNRDMVREYRLGVWVEPDSAAAIREGLLHWLANGIAPRWEDYRRDYSWDRNAALIEERIQEFRRPGK